MLTKNHIHILDKEWDNLRISLEKCGEIGEYNFLEHQNGSYIDSKGSNLAICASLMDRNDLSKRYFTNEAYYVFSTLATIAAQRLGISEPFTRSFGMGYSAVRTGIFEIHPRDNYSILKQKLFFDFFFKSEKCLEWDFHSETVKENFKFILDKYYLWQTDPICFLLDLEKHKTQLKDFMQGLYLLLDLPQNLSEKRFEKINKILNLDMAAGQELSSFN